MDTPCGGHDNELETKVGLSRSLKNVNGNVWWHGYWVTDNYKGALDALASKHQRALALPSAYKEGKGAPAKVTGLRTEQRGKDNVVAWDFPSNFPLFRNPVDEPAHQLQLSLPQRPQLLGD